MRRRSPDMIVELCDTTDQFCVELTGCGGCATPSPEYELWIRRRGQKYWLLLYPAWDVSPSGRICFRVDDQFPKEHGRYDAQVRDYNNDVVGEFEIVIPRTRLVSVTRERGRRRRPMSKPQGVSNMYEPIEGWTTQLCGILEKTDTVLPLDSTDISFLCGLVLCKPAQLVIDDGINSEVIEWRCVGNAIEIERAVDGNGPFRFPRGAEVRFDWTEANVVRAMEGC